MLIDVKLDFPNTRSLTGRRRDFWRIFQELKTRDFAGIGESIVLSQEEADGYERRFAMGFPVELQRLVNTQLEYRRDRRDSFSDQPRRIELQLRTVEYNSIHAIMELIGVDNAELHEFVLTLLAIYAPVAFREALDIDVSMNASVSVIEKPVTTGSTTAAAAGRSKQFLNQAWFIANTSLVLPVALALGVCYFAFLAMTQETERLKSQSNVLGTQNADLLKAVVDQNVKLSALLVEQSNKSETTAKALQELLVGMVKKNDPTRIP